jgi:hypothetical protein
MCFRQGQLASFLCLSIQVSCVSSRDMNRVYGATLHTVLQVMIGMALNYG